LKRNNILFLFIYFALESAKAQSIHFELPAQKGKTLYLSATKGIRQDTLFSEQIDEKGNVIFKPTKDKPLSVGVVSLIIKPNIHFDFIYSPLENMTLHCESENINAQNTQFKNSLENNFIESRFAEQAQRQEKIMFCKQRMQRYRENDNEYGIIEKEKTSLEQQQLAFESMLERQSANLYSARLIKLKNLMSNYTGRLDAIKDSTEYVRIRKYLLSNLDAETLYRSGIWLPVINGMLRMYYKQAPFYGQFGNDMVKLLRKTRSQEVFLELASNAATICNQFGWNTDETALSKYLALSSRITSPKGILKQMLILNKLQPDMPAPKVLNIDNTKINFASKKKTLIVFYESDCSNCKNAMSQLVNNYSRLKEKSIKVISIAADTNVTIFQNTSRNFPWHIKLCDFKGFEGNNFKNYAIIGTPTFYLVDENGIIKGKFASYEEITNYLKN